MSELIVFSSFYILYIFLFDRSILSKKKTSTGILVLTILCFVTGHILTYVEFKGGELLKVPLLQFLLFKVFYLIFIKIFKREPLDSFWTMDKKLMKDGVFNFILGIIPVLIVLKGYV
jgi:hypothetical protein